MLCRRIDPSGHRCRLIYISEVKPAQVQMGAAIEREATAVLKDAEQLAKVDTIEELVALLILTVIALLGIWVLYRLDSAPVWDLSKIDEFTKAWTAIACCSRVRTRRTPATSLFLERPRTGTYACVGHNAKKTYLVDAEQRAQLVRVVVDADPVLRNRVTVVTTAGYVWREAKRLKCAALYRGVRSWGADGFSETVLHVLNLVCAAGVRSFPSRRSRRWRARGLSTASTPSTRLDLHTGARSSSARLKPVATRASRPTPPRRLG